SRKLTASSWLMARSVTSRTNQRMRRETTKWRVRASLKAPAKCLWPALCGCWRNYRLRPIRRSANDQPSIIRYREPAALETSHGHCRNRPAIGGGTIAELCHSKHPENQYARSRIIQARFQRIVSQWGERQSYYTTHRLQILSSCDRREPEIRIPER